jgi:hypothetical protein
MSLRQMAEDTSFTGRLFYVPLLAWIAIWVVVGVVEYFFL